MNSNYRGVRKKIIIEGMTSSLGGLEKFIYTLFQVIKNDWQVDFLTVDNDIPFHDEFLKNGSHIYRVTPRHENIKKYKEEIKKIFDDNQYDVFWFNKTTLSAIYSLKVAKLNNVKKIICHSHASENMGNKFTLMMHKLNQRWVNKNIKYKVACSTNAAHWFFGNNINNVLILPNAVDITDYDPNIQKSKDMKNKFGIKDELVIGHIGRFSKEKNQTFLIDVFLEILKKQNSRLLLCGTGPTIDEIKEKVKYYKIEDKVSFLGVRNDIPDVLQSIDIFIMPSLFEGLPFALVEAQAAGIPCIVSNTVSSDSKLTDLIEFVDLNESPVIWANKALYYKEYKKVSKRNQLFEKGYTIESFEEKVNTLIRGEFNE